MKRPRPATIDSDSAASNAGRLAEFHAARDGRHGRRMRRSSRRRDVAASRAGPGDREQDPHGAEAPAARSRRRRSRRPAGVAARRPRDVRRPRDDAEDPLEHGPAAAAVRAPPSSATPAPSADLQPAAARRRRVFLPSQFSQLAAEATAAEGVGRRRFGSIFIFCGDRRRGRLQRPRRAVPPSQFLQVGSRCCFDRRDDNDDCGGAPCGRRRERALRRAWARRLSEGSWSDASHRRARLPCRRRFRRRGGRCRMRAADTSPVREPPGASEHRVGSTTTQPVARVIFRSSSI